MPGGRSFFARGFLVVPFGGIVVDEKMRRRAVVDEKTRRELELEDKENGRIRRERMGICKQIGWNGGNGGFGFLSPTTRVHTAFRAKKFHPESERAPGDRGWRGLAGWMKGQIRTKTGNRERYWADLRLSVLSSNSDKSHLPTMDVHGLLLEKTLLLGLFAAAVLAIVVAKLKGKRFRLPPGPSGAPIVGNWLEVGDDLNHRKLMGLAKRFGEVFLLRMGVRNLVVVSSPELAKEVLHTQGVEFGSRNRNLVLDIFTGKGQDMVFSVYGDHWRKMRRIMTVPFFTSKVVAQSRAGWEEEARLLVEDLKADPASATEGVVLWRGLQLMMG
ncbi:hypothetical protein QYE76_028094 [Lolium multiflorum]|uniref:Cinnamate 4-hydroxylase n=1 Tax=Lolium multiflorum TaxID=4521 RepID=A0AAD8QLM7_LOLMU|nr:hypothetical protein QYE76_028094 [Lolium multiflorum]